MESSYAEKTLIPSFWGVRQINFEHEKVKELMNVPADDAKPA